MTDLDWLTAYSNLAWAASQQLQPGAGLGFVEADLEIPVTFGASEAFTGFQIAVPFVAPGQSTVFGMPDANWTDLSQDLSLTQFELTDSPSVVNHGILISGENTSASSLDVTFKIHYVFPVAAT